MFGKVDTVAFSILREMTFLKSLCHLHIHCAQHNACSKVIAGGDQNGHVQDTFVSQPNLLP